MRWAAAAPSSAAACQTTSEPVRELASRDEPEVDADCAMPEVRASYKRELELRAADGDGGSSSSSSRQLRRTRRAEARDAGGDAGGGADGQLQPALPEAAELDPQLFVRGGELRAWD